MTKAQIEQRQKQEEKLKKLNSDKIKPPKWLGKEAKKIFKSITDEMAVMGILANVDVYGLAVLADAMEKYIVCTITLHTENLSYIRISKSGDEFRDENPTVRTQIKYAELFKKYAADYGLSPASRLKIIQQHMPELDDDEQEFEDEFG